MSTQLEAPVTTEKPAKNGSFLYTFPPFPSAPEGVTLIAFKDFKECGIQIQQNPEDGDIEVDGLGIPTVEILKKHDIDQPKTDAKRRKRARQAQQVLQSNGAPEGKKEWWMQWQEVESLRYTGSYDPFDRVHQANIAFRQRSWPNVSTGVRGLYDQFQLYAGLLANIPIWHKIDKNKPEDEDDDDVEDEDEPTKVNIKVPEPQRRPRPPRARIPYSTYGKDPIEVNDDGEIRDLLDDEAAVKEDKLADFLNDPERSVQVFLSSYMRKQGLIWADKNLVNMPHLLYFFINFLIGNRVLPEPEHERGLQRALKVIELARKELPLTSKMAKALPDDFNLACKACWGTQGTGYETFYPDAMDVVKDDKDSNEPEAKRLKLDTDTEDATTAEESFVAKLKAENIQLLTSADITMADVAKDAIEDNIDPGVAADSIASGWGTDGGATWGASTSAENAQSVDAWETTHSSWAAADPHSLIPLLGPTTLPLTHTPGIVEWSVRRIKEIIPPPTVANKSAIPTDPDADPDPETVEAELIARFTRVVLTPWTGWEDPEDEEGQSAPRIFPSSRGPVVDPKDAAGVELEGDAAKPPTGGRKPHDPTKDDITIFVGASVLDTLSMGMGLGGTWVQLARQQEDFERPDGEEKPKKKKKKSKSKKSGARFWYMEELVMTLTSYHLV